MFDPHVCTYQVVTYHLQQYETYLYNIFCYILTLFYVCGTYFSTCFYKKATSIRTFYHKNLIPCKSVIIKKTFQIENATLYKNAHGFEPIKQFCVFLLSCTDLICHRRILRVGKILSKTYTKINSNTKIVGNLYTAFQNHFFLSTTFTMNKFTSHLVITLPFKNLSLKLLPEKIANILCNLYMKKCL